MNEPPPIRIFIAPVLMFCVVGMLVGILVGMGVDLKESRQIFWFAAGGLSLGLPIGVAVTWNLLKVYLPERWSIYASEARSLPLQESVTEILISTPDGVDRIKSELSPDDWSVLAHAVIKTGNFTLGACKLAFGVADGESIYQAVREKLLKSKCVYEYGNGYKVTDKGKHVFKQLAKGESNILRALSLEELQ